MRAAPRNSPFATFPSQVPAPCHTGPTSLSRSLPMRPAFLLTSVACMLAAGPGRADEFRNPRVIEVRAPGGDLTIRARRGTAAVPGLGEVEQVYAYDVRRGRSLPPESAGAVELMPP